MGYFCPLSLHEYIEVKGILEDHSVHGLQLISKRFTVSYPKGVDDIKAYLKQGAIPGLSAKEIEILLDKHGSELLRVMSGNPNLLVSTTSLSKKKIERIKKTLKFHTDIRELSTYLLSNGLKPGYADSIYTLFSDSFQQQIQQNPYQLCQDFVAIPFPDVDRLALTGFEESSTERIKAALDYVMHIQGQKGFFHIDYHALIQQCQMLTELEDYQIKSALDRMITRSEYMLQQKTDSTFMVFTKYTEKRLKRIFSKLKSITQTPLDQFVYIANSTTSIEKSFESADQAELVFQLLDDHIGAEKITIINTTRSSDFYVEQCILFFETNDISYCCFDKLNKPDDFFSSLSYNPMTGVYEKNAITHLSANCILIANAHLLSFTDLYAITEAMNERAQIILIGDTSIHQRINKELYSR